MALFAALALIAKSTAFQAGVAALGAGATVYGITQQRQAAKENKRSNRIEAARARMQQTRNIRRAIAASRVAQAQGTAAGVQSGTSESSALQGALSGEAAQTAGGIGFATTQFNAGQSRFLASGRADSAVSRANTAAGIGKVATAVSGTTPGRALFSWANREKDSFFYPDVSHLE